MAAETLSFVDAFDQAFIVKHNLESMLGQDIPLIMMTDSKQLFDFLTKNKYKANVD